MKQHYSGKTFFCLALVIIAIGVDHDAWAQSAMMAGTNFAAQRRAVLQEVAPDKEAYSEILGTSEGTRYAGMSESQVNAFLSSSRNWFHSIGKGQDNGAKPIKLDGFAKILNEKDEATYRSLFASIASNDLSSVPQRLAALEDKILIGHIKAALLLSSRAPRFHELQEWLSQYADLPEADELYRLASKTAPSRKDELKKPNHVAIYSGSVERADGGGVMLWDTDSILKLANKGPDGKEFIRKLKAAKFTEATEQLGANMLDDDAGTDAAARLTLAEMFLRRGRGAEAWNFIKAIDFAATPFEPTSRAYALWIKGLVAWTAGHYHAAYQSFSSVFAAGVSGPNKAGAAYWAARAAERLNKSVDMTDYLQKASAYPRSFYGLLALTRINAAAQYNWSLPEFTKAHADLFKRDESGRRALALLQVGERMLAEAELREIELREKNELKSGVLALAARYHLPSLSVQIGSALSKGRLYDSALYPLMPWQPEKSYTSDPALVLAIARNESHFNHVARSPVGAVGVMQIMPQTAESMQAGASKTLYDPTQNVTLGDRYIDMLTRTAGIGDNLLFIIGSYNCGPKRMLSLFESTKKQNGNDPLLFIETLPIKETRDYMQKVMATYWIYRARFDRPLKAMAELTIGRWPTYNKGDTRLVSASSD